MPPSKHRLSIGVLAALAAATSASGASAESSSSAVIACSPPLTLIPALPDARLIGAHGGGGGGRALIQPSGLYVGLDAGAALMPAVGDAPTRGAAAFGLHLGYRLPSGLAFDLRGDDLGVDAPDGGGPLIAGGFGMRYTVPLEVMPFVEAHLGALDYGPHVSVAGDAALGIALPVGDHLEIDVSARDWIADVDGAIRHMPMFALGLEVGFDRGR
jgi:hypothetical protein